MEHDQCYVMVCDEHEEMINTSGYIYPPLMEVCPQTYTVYVDQGTYYIKFRSNKKNYHAITFVERQINMQITL